jgi:tetratricopeptide (TPR) repeat protein
MKGWVYVITNEAMPGLVKVGWSSKDAVLRASELDSPASPHYHVVRYDILVEEAYSAEQKVHRLLASKLEGKEWFRCSVQEAIEAIQKVIEEPSHQIKKIKVDFWEGVSKEIKDLLTTGEDLARLNKYEEALACFNKVLEIDPSFVDGLHHKGTTLCLLHRYEEGLACFNEGLRIMENTLSYKAESRYYHLLDAKAKTEAFLNPKRGWWDKLTGRS